MPAPNASQQIDTQPLKMVSGNFFGRYSKISDEQTFNMIVSDNALVPYAGYKNVLTQSPTQKGRGIYASSRGNIMLTVWGSNIYVINPALEATFIGTVETTSGRIFFSENNNGEITFTDNINIYTYNWYNPTSPLVLSSATGGISIPSTLVNPGFIAFQNGRLITGNTTGNGWYLSNENDSTVWPSDAAHIGSLQSKPDLAQAALPVPGGGNNLVLFGNDVMELWQDVGNALFPYQRASSFNVDFGTINPESIAFMDNYIVWLAGNETAGVSLMVYTGNKGERISTDGIDYVLANLTDPSNCIGFLFRQDGHMIYQFTFITDNLSFIYDLNTKMFFTVTDENLNYHIAQNVVYFNNAYYFVSINGGNLYEFGTQYTDYDYGDGNVQQIPRLRICPPIRLTSQRMFILKSIGFTAENGQPNTGSEAIDMAISRDGGASFGSSRRYNMNPTGQRKSRIIFQRCGQANDASIQFRFIGFERFVVFEGEAEIYQ